MNRVPLLVALPVVVPAAFFAGCAVKPQMEDLHIPGGLAGFVYDANATSARTVFPEREPLRQYGWFTFGEPANAIMVTKYSGSASAEDVERARAAQARRYGSAAMQYGEVESITLDGRTGWGWLETQTHRGELASLEYKAVVSCDSVTYAVEFHAARADYQDVAKLRAVVGRFEVGRVRRNVAGIVASVVLGLGILAVVPRIGRQA